MRKTTHCARVGAHLHLIVLELRDFSAIYVLYKISIKIVRIPKHVSYEIKHYGILLRYLFTTKPIFI